MNIPVMKSQKEFNTKNLSCRVAFYCERTARHNWWLLVEKNENNDMYFLPTDTVLFVLKFLSKATTGANNDVKCLQIDKNFTFCTIFCSFNLV